MIARVSTFVAIVSALAATATAQDSNRLFDVSLSATHVMDLSPVYQQIIREATEAYRGDGDVVTIRRTAVRTFSPRLTSGINPPPELQEDFDPFPQVPFTLSGKPDQVTPRP